LIWFANVFGTGQIIKGGLHTIRSNRWSRTGVVRLPSRQVTFRSPFHRQLKSANFTAVGLRSTAQTCSLWRANRAARKPQPVPRSRLLREGRQTMKFAVCKEEPEICIRAFSA